MAIELAPFGKFGRFLRGFETGFSAFGFGCGLATSGFELFSLAFCSFSTTEPPGDLTGFVGTLNGPLLSVNQNLN